METEWDIPLDELNTPSERDFNHPLLLGALLLVGGALGAGLAMLSNMIFNFYCSKGHSKFDKQERQLAHPDEGKAVDWGGKNDYALDDVTGLEDEDFLLATGFSMEEARRLADRAQQQASMKTPREVLTELQRGNARFWSGYAQRPDISAFGRRAQISRQYPMTAIISCSDARVPVEIVFDQGLGDMFVIRVAGNCLDTSTVASLQYAVFHLQVKVVIVMGHEGCSAIKAARLSDEQIASEPDALASLLSALKTGLPLEQLSLMADHKASDRLGICANVRRQVETLVLDVGLMSRVMEGKLILVGAFYEICSGIVDFFHEVSTEHPDIAASMYEDQSPASLERVNFIKNKQPQ